MGLSETYVMVQHVKMMKVMVMHSIAVDTMYGFALGYLGSS